MGDNDAPNGAEVWNDGMAFEREQEAVVGLERLIGRLESRIDSLEDRADKQEHTLIAMDGKLDEIMIMLAQSAGGRRQINSLAKYGIAFLAAVGSAGGLMIALIHYLAGNLNAR